ncbi:MAG: alpha-ketoglutarate-dependent dioxygenase AlkB [Pseudomonadota bacterium]
MSNSTADNPGKPLLLRGFEIYRGFIGESEQSALVEDVRSIAKEAPLFSPITRFGKPMRVRMTSAGRYGWYSDRRGYRYERRHPSGSAWPPIPPRVLALWRQITGLERSPDCCLINFYDAEARMGLHQDCDEADFSFPVLSISLGDDGLFRIGNKERGGTTDAVWLSSGDVVVMGGEARLTFHGIDKIRPGSSTLLKDGGRLNLTLRVVD